MSSFLIHVIFWGQTIFLCIHSEIRLFCALVYTLKATFVGRKHRFKGKNDWILDLSSLF